jgi:hypothetical protein
MFFEILNFLPGLSCFLNDSISCFKTSMDRKSCRGVLTIDSNALVLTKDFILTIDAGKGAAPWPVFAGFNQSGHGLRST